MRPSQRTGLAIGVGLIVAVLVLNGADGFRQARQMHVDANWVAHTHEVLETLAQILSGVKDAETGVRGFVITGEDRYLEPYRRARSSIDEQVEKGASLTSDNPTQQAQFPKLRALVTSELDELEKIVAARKPAGDNDAAKALVATDRGKQTMDDIRALVAEMQVHERELLAQRQQRNDAAYRSAAFGALLSVVLGMVAVGGFVWILRTHLRSLAKSASAIHEQREWLRTTLASIGDAVIATDVGGRVAFVNPIAESLTGWTNAAALGQPLEKVFEIVNEQTRNTVENPALRALREGTIVGLANHTVLIARDGAEHAIDDSAAPIRDEQQRVVGVVLVFRDVGERRAAERALQTSEARKAAVLRASLDSVITVDARGRIIEFNPAAEALFGYSHDEAISQDINRLFSAESGAFWSVNGDGSLAQEAASKFNTRQEATARRRDGDERLIEFVITPLEGSQPPLYSIFSRDITQQREAQEQVSRLLTGEKHRAELLSHLARASLTIHSATSRESVMGVIKSEASEIVGAKRVDVLLGRDGAELPPGGIAVPLVGRDGQPFARLLLAEKVAGDFTADDQAILNQLALIAAVAIDNADLYEELRSHDRHKDEFLATLAHELRNPLAPIRSALEVMRLAEDDPSVLNESQTMIDRQVKQMVRLIDDLLDLSRISRGKIELRKERIDLADALKSAVETSRPLIAESGHQLETDLDPQPMLLDADLTRLAQVFLNLLNNSAKYTAPGGRIWLSSAREGDFTVVRVRDNGVGIPPQMLGRIFEMFTQVERSLERAQGGLGIGLTLVRRLVEMHGGTVEAKSEGLGTGSEFTVRIPLAPFAHPASSDGQPGDHPSTSAQKRRRILVVDDNQDAANSLAMLLRIKGHDVRTAYDGISAVDVAALYKPDVVLLDVGLPRLNGFDAARRIREAEHGKNIVLVALTGWGHAEDRRRSKEAGFDHHFVKPADPNMLDTVLNSLNGN
ncbi:MAG TPA: CHASE3 domain-containing protein [Planctomycetaceae bacterium]|nr:CHASE3 domain-containing protein [Planctomycetaceae bacterium]